MSRISTYFALNLIRIAGSSTHCSISRIGDSKTAESMDDALMEKIQSEDVLTEVLVLLPPKSIFRFICVSKRWRNIITNPSFLRRYSAAARRCCGGGRLLALFQRASLCYFIPANNSNTLSITMPGHNINNNIIPRKFGYFTNSSNGLILCCYEVDMYHVINPVTGKYFSLPLPLHRLGRIATSAGIMCEENTNYLAPIYTVVQACVSQFSKIFYVDIYSSRTGKWSDRRGLVVTGTFCLVNKPPVVASGVFHWYWYFGKYNVVEGIAVYDLNDNRLQLIEVPCFDSNNGSCAVTRSGDDDLLWFRFVVVWANRICCGFGLLWFGQIGSERMRLFVLLKVDQDGAYRRETAINRDQWVLVYDSSVDLLCEDLKNLDASRRMILEWIVSPWNSQIVAVLRQDKEVFVFKSGSNSIEEVGHFGGLSL